VISSFNINVTEGGHRRWKLSGIPSELRKNRDNVKPGSGGVVERRLEGKVDLVDDTDGVLMLL